MHFFKFQGGIEIFFIPPTLTPKKLFGGVIKNDVTEMIQLLTFQSIKNVFYFLNLGGYRNMFYRPTPLHQKNKLFWGGIKNDVTEMIHLLTFQSIKNVFF